MADVRDHPSVKAFYASVRDLERGIADFQVLADPQLQWHLSDGLPNGRLSKAEFLAVSAISRFLEPPVLPRAPVVAGDVEEPLVAVTSDISRPGLVGHYGRHGREITIGVAAPGATTAEHSVPVNLNHRSDQVVGMTLPDLPAPAGGVVMAISDTMINLTGQIRSGTLAVSAEIRMLTPPEIVRYRFGGAIVRVILMPPACSKLTGIALTRTPRFPTGIVGLGNDAHLLADDDVLFGEQVALQRWESFAEMLRADSLPLPPLRKR